jgi:hypothetical protein
VRARRGACGTISLATARRHYGVAIDPESWTADEAETAELRSGGALTGQRADYASPAA